MAKQKKGNDSDQPKDLALFTENIRQIVIEDEMKNAYLDYAMSVIIGRALPDVRDGLKPVHRRILHAMNLRGWRSDRSYVKSAKIVGEVIGNFHPHGDTAVYDTIVRMAQDFAMRIPLIDGQGNFGSLDGDRAAAYRYTEARLTKIAEELLQDIDKDTVDFVNNFDDTRTEPVVLPAAYPNLLVNGSSGIAVGMATNIPPHNLGEVIDATNLLIENPDATISQIMKKLPSPDFPTGGIIVGRSGLKNAYEKGRGSLLLRAKYSVEEINRGKEAIIVTEIPYQVNKANLIARIAELVRNKIIEDISDLRDESDREGMRIVIELKKDANTQIVINKLLKLTSLQISFNIIMLALVDGQPKVMGIKEVLQHYIRHRYDVVVRRTKFELDKAEKRAHILEGLKIALDNIDEVIRIIRSSKTVDEARQRLMKTFSLSEIQADAILEMKLQKLTSLEVQKIIDELKQIRKLIIELKEILKSDAKKYNIISTELTNIKQSFAKERMTVIEAEEANNFEVEDLIADEDMVISVSRDGFIRRMPVEAYKKQNRGGKGVMTASQAGKKEDYINLLTVASTHDFLLLFSNKGKIFVLKTYEIPEASKTSRGKSLKAIINLSQDEMITAMTGLPDFSEDYSIALLTKSGILKKSECTIFQNAKKGGIIAITLKKDDELIGATVVGKDADIVMASRQGNILRTNLGKMRNQGRQASGIIGMRLEADDYIIGMQLVQPEKEMIMISEKGYGKRMKYNLFPAKGRGGKGMTFVKITDKNGPAVAINSVAASDDIILITHKGLSLRIAAESISQVGRTAVGVRIANIHEDDMVIDMAVIPDDPAK